MGLVLDLATEPQEVCGNLETCSRRVCSQLRVDHEMRDALPPTNNAGRFAGEVVTAKRGCVTSAIAAQARHPDFGHTSCRCLHLEKYHTIHTIHTMKLILIDYYRRSCDQPELRSIHRQCEWNASAINYVYQLSGPRRGRSIAALLP